LVAASREGDNVTGPDIDPIRTQDSKAAGRLYSALRLCFSKGSP
jgi:hypothetical protein